MKRSCTLVVLLAVPILALTQLPTQTIRGIITDADTHRPLAGATVSIAELEMGAVTDSSGHYRLVAAPVGRYQMEVRHVGYEELLLAELLVESGKECVFNLELKERALDLEAVGADAEVSDHQFFAANGDHTDLSFDDAYRIGDEEALNVIFRLVAEEGLCLGGSSGINVAGAIKLARDLGPGATIVTILCDYGNRYASKLYNPEFLKSKGLPVPPWMA